MRITVTIPDELTAQVQAQGFAVEPFVNDLVQQKALGEARGRGQATGRITSAISDDFMQFNLERKC